MDCTIEVNQASCTCTYEGCPRKGKCCECVAYHRNKKQLPACFFTREAEASYDRSYGRFISENS
ncbi:MAG: DUF6485 family protein [Syntrophorhabdus sp.]